MNASCSSARSSFGSAAQDVCQFGTCVESTEVERTVLELFLHHTAQLPALVFAPPRELCADGSFGPAPPVIEADKLEQARVRGRSRDLLVHRSALPLAVVDVDHLAHLGFLLSLLAPRPPRTRTTRHRPRLVLRAPHQRVAQRAGLLIEPDHPRERPLRDEPGEAAPLLAQLVGRVRREALVEALEVLLRDDRLARRVVCGGLCRGPPPLRRRCAWRALDFLARVVPLEDDAFAPAEEAQEAVAGADAVLGGGGGRVGSRGGGGGENEEVQAGGEEFDALRGGRCVSSRHGDR